MEKQFFRKLIIWAIPLLVGCKFVGVAATELPVSEFCKNPGHGSRVCQNIKELTIDARYNGISLSKSGEHYGEPNSVRLYEIQKSIEEFIVSDTSLKKKLNSIEFDRPPKGTSLPEAGELRIIFDVRVNEILKDSFYVEIMVMSMTSENGYHYGLSGKVCGNDACVKAYISQGIKRYFLYLSGSI